MVALTWCLELLPTAIRGEGSLLDHHKKRRATQESNSIRLRLVTLDAAASLVCRVGFWHDFQQVAVSSLRLPDFPRVVGAKIPEMSFEIPT